MIGAQVGDPGIASKAGWQLWARARPRAWPVGARRSCLTLGEQRFGWGCSPGVGDGLEGRQALLELANLEQVRRRCGTCRSEPSGSSRTRATRSSLRRHPKPDPVATCCARSSIRPGLPGARFRVRKPQHDEPTTKGGAHSAIRRRRSRLHTGRSAPLGGWERIGRPGGH
jgi:hypothetical protein